MSRSLSLLMSFWLRGRARIYTRIVTSNFGTCGNGVRILPPFRFSNLAHVRLGSNVIINQDCWILTVGAPRADGGPKLDIGSNCEIGMGATISAASHVKLGDHVLLARNVYISDHGHAYENISEPIMDQGITNASAVNIGRESWLGQNVVILPGVTIGEHCVIGANAVVKTSIPDCSVAVGSPARVVKHYDRTTGQWRKPSPSSATQGQIDETNNFR